MSIVVFTTIVCNFVCCSRVIPLMNRKSFLRNLGWVTAAGATGWARADAGIPQVGFNHLPSVQTKTMNTVLHQAETRGHANHGWLDSHHTFSFAHYYDPARMHFGVLRVLNDDWVDGGKGFGTHPHDNMEIISIPLVGDLEHKDSMGNRAVIRQNDVQIMSAGTGIYHSEYNHHADKKVNFLQIWVFPKQRDIQPRYDQKTFLPEARLNRFQTVVSPLAAGEGVGINQDAWFSLGNLQAGFETSYAVRQKGNGVYAFMIRGEAVVNGQPLRMRDGLGSWNVDTLTVKATADTELLLMDVPMN